MLLFQSILLISVSFIIIVTVKLKAGLLLNASLRICPLTFINEAFCLSGSRFVASTMSP